MWLGHPLIRMSGRIQNIDIQLVTLLSASVSDRQATADNAVAIPIGAQVAMDRASRGRVRLEVCGDADVNGVFSGTSGGLSHSL